MKQKMCRVLSLLLSVVMVLGLMPATAFATATTQNASGLETMKVASPSNAAVLAATPSNATSGAAEGNITVRDVKNGNDGNGNTFSTMEELTALLDALTDDESRTFEYTGSEDFVIDEDLMVPGFIELMFGDTNLVVENGVTFEAECWIACNDMIVNGEAITSGKLEIDGCLNVAGSMKNSWDIDAGDLDVSGTMEANGWISVWNSVNISGSMTVSNNGMGCGSQLVVAEDASLKLKDCSLDIEYPWTLDIKGNFSYSNDRAIWVNRWVASVAEMETALNDAAHEKDPAIGYFIWINAEQAGNRIFEIANNMVIPANVRLQWDNIDQIDIKSGATVTVNGNLQIYIPLIVNGTLMNNQRIEVANQTGRDYRPPFDGVLEICQGGQYTGGGDVGVYTDIDVTSISHIIKGLNMTFSSAMEQDHIYWYNGGNGGSVYNLYFETFEELADLINSVGNEEKHFHYEVNAPFTIADDLVIPGNVEIEFHENLITIPAGVTVTCDGDIYGSDLDVAGTLNINQWLNLQNSLTVSGTVTAKQSFRIGSQMESRLEITNTGRVELGEGAISIEYPGQVIGLDRIITENNYTAVVFNGRFKTMDELKALANEIANDTTYAGDERVNFNMYISGDYSQNMSEFVFTENLTIPEKAELQLYDTTYVIDENVTLINNGFIWLASPLVVNGKLDNNNYVNVSYRQEKSDDRGTISLGTNGIIEHDNEKEFRVLTSSSVKDITTVLPWFNSDDYELEERFWDDGTKVWIVRFAHGLIKLATPIDPKWGLEYREQWSWDEEKQMGVITGWDVLQKPGFMSWKTDLPDQAEVQVHVYRVGEDKPCASERWGFDPQEQPEYRSVDTFMRKDLPSGDYYFTVQSLGDYIKYSNSDVAKSGVYKYKKPSASLPAVNNMVWEDRNDHLIAWANWDASSTSPYVDGFEVDLYYCETENGTYKSFGGSRGRGYLNTDSPLANHFFQEKGEGYYKYKVRYLSGNLDKIANGPWSDFSQVLDLKKIPQMVDNALDQLEQNAQQMTADQVRNAVQQMDKDDLKKTLLTDQENNGATQTLANLENLAGGQAPVSVSQDASAFNVNEVSVVGANLNNSASTTDPITLVIDKPAKEHVIPERFDSSVSVSFSMTLANVNNPQNLEVPVKITLPIPASINPEFLVILHYHLDGTREWIWPHVYAKNGKMYADFVVTGFSDFIMTEEIPADYNNGNTGNGGNGNSGSDDSDHSGGGYVSSGTKAKKEALPEYVVSGQWTSADGKWMFADKNGEVYKNRWAAVENPYADTKAGQSAFDWFFFDANGHMVTGWFFDGINWYYLNPVSDGTQGRMFTGWQLINGKWYYLNPVSDGTKGAMAADAWIDIYYVDASGAWDETKTK